MIACGSRRRVGAGSGRRGNGIRRRCSGTCGKARSRAPGRGQPTAWPSSRANGPSTSRRRGDCAERRDDDRGTEDRRRRGHRWRDHGRERRALPRQARVRTRRAPGEGAPGGREHGTFRRDRPHVLLEPGHARTREAGPSHVRERPGPAGRRLRVPAHRIPPPDRRASARGRGAHPRVGAAARAPRRAAQRGRSGRSGASSLPGRRVVRHPRAPLRLRRPDAHDGEPRGGGPPVGA